MESCSGWVIVRDDATVGNDFVVVIMLQWKMMMIL